MAVRKMVAVLLACSSSAASHSITIIPAPRNAVDKDTPLFLNGSFPFPNGEPGCQPTSSVCGCWCTNGTEPCLAAQTCFWFSQGCTIGCSECTGYDARAQVDTCGIGMQPTICDPRLRTYNVGAECGSEADIYKHNPWRAPGTAPIFDACGRAGGGYLAGPVGPGAAMFTNTTHAKQGDLGSQVLVPTPSQATWKIGSEVEVMWGLRANHGGGFQWRLCPAREELTEACFQRTPLPFVGRQILVYANGTRMPIPSKYAYANGSVAAITADGQAPVGITWAMNPLPDLTQDGSLGAAGAFEFPTPCPEDASYPNISVPEAAEEGAGGPKWPELLCSGERPFRVSIVDVLAIPDHVPPGEYVVGFRWDVEETAQVWNSCSDVTIVA